MERSFTEPEAVALLCDAAESVGGKLYILGAGWSQFLANNPTNMVIAIKLLIPWSRANEAITVRVSLADEDREETMVIAPAPDTDPKPVEGEASIEMGRPAGLKRGTSLDTSFVLPFPGVSLPQGGYVWKVEVNGKEKARIPIQAVSPHG